MEIEYTCTRCGLSKPASAFTHYKGKPETICKKCRAAAAEARRRAKGVPVATYSKIEGETKLCLHCMNYKPFSEFTALPRGIGGLSSYCKECKSIRDRLRYEEKSEEIIAQTTQWGKDNPEKMAEYRQRWSDNNPELERVSMIARAQRTRFKELAGMGIYVEDDGSVTNEFLLELYARTNCHYCTEFVPSENRTQDHKTPLTRGGAHTTANLVMACEWCNSRKHKKTEAEYLAALGR